MLFLASFFIENKILIMELQEAGPMNFLKTILILILVYYAFKIIMRLLAPYLMKKAMHKMQQKAEQQFNKQQKEDVVKEGETVIDKTPKKTKSSNKNVGEYVDFEEID